METHESVGVVEELLGGIKKISIGGALFCLIFGALMALLGLVGMIHDLSIGLKEDMPIYTLFILLGGSLIGVSIYRLCKRKRLKQDMYTYLIAVGTAESPQALATKVNAEFRKSTANTELQKAGLVITEHYIVCKDSTVEIAPRDSVLCILHGANERGRAGDVMLIRVFCRHVPGLKRQYVAFSVRDKNIRLVMQALRSLCLPMATNEDGEEQFLKLSTKDYPAFERACIQRFGLAESK